MAGATADDAGREEHATMGTVKKSKPIYEAKMRELLAKLRKGADSSLTLSKLEEVLRFLGG